MSFDSCGGELPLSLDQLRDQWNAQADDFNQWDSLGLDEQIGWAQARAIAADRAKRQGVPPTERLPDNRDA